MKPIYTISYSSIRAAALCPQRFINAIVHRYVPKQSTTFSDTQFGTIWHEFRKRLLRGEGKISAVTNAMKLWQDVPHRKPKEQAYLTNNWITSELATHIMTNDYDNPVGGFTPFKHNGNALVEEKFSLPLLVTDHYELHLTGIIDAIGYFDGVLVIQDDKTTSFSWPEKYFEQYSYSSQMLLYMNVVAMLQELYPDSPLAQAGEVFGVTVVGVFLTPKKLMVQRSPLYTYTDSMLEDAHEALLHLVNERFKPLLDLYHNDPNRQDFAKVGFVTDACKDIGNTVCPYLEVCSLDDKAIAKQVLQQRYEVKPRTTE